MQRTAVVPAALDLFGTLSAGKEGGVGPGQLWRSTFVTFLRADSEVPFDLTSPSVCAAGSAALAQSLKRKLCAALVSVP